MYRLNSSNRYRDTSESSEGWCLVFDSYDRLKLAIGYDFFHLPEYLTVLAVCDEDAVPLCDSIVHLTHVAAYFTVARCLSLFFGLGRVDGRKSRLCAGI